MSHHSATIVPVILCGGSGTRLWPLSRKSHPKQFVPLIGHKSLLRLTAERLAFAKTPLLCVAAEDHRFLVADDLKAAGLGGELLLEPAGRNTAAAMALAALHARSQADQNAAQGADPLLLFCPADHHIPDTAAFAAMVQQGVAAAESGAIVTFGVLPSFPSTAYGYIAQGAERADGSRAVARFIEKPQAEAAQALLLQGQVLWNAGIFLTRTSVLLAALQVHAGDILASCQAAMAGATSETPPATHDQPGLHFVRPQKDAFLACRSQSIDYAVMEHHPDVAVVPFVGQWSDVGSWNAVADLTPADAQGNRIEGQGHALRTQNTYIHAPGRTVVALGTQDLLIIDTPDALLVAHRDAAEQVKDVVAHLEGAQLPQATLHRRVARPWGWYDSIDMGERFQV
ncbi:MAG: mannose-1-phosphate guanylyltransferase/mannose-6-phosphate isomerase, partial [Hydrogenophaga sp.]|nr:mannose-1-phosphate guanylyltransferase/mannose-6-phosphate isomerase [Hydrogenophaga sp.]